MDPNEALRLAREAAGELRNADDDDTLEGSQVGQLVEAFEALDEWLSKGGFAPNDWTTYDEVDDDHPEHTECADGCGLAVTHQGACLDKPGGRQVCEHDVADEDPDEEYGPYEIVCGNCGNTINEEGFDHTGSRRCDDLDPEHRYHAPKDEEND